MALTTTDPLDAALVKADFPLLARTVHGKPIVYPKIVKQLDLRWFYSWGANPPEGVPAGTRMPFQE